MIARKDTEHRKTAPPFKVHGLRTPRGQRTALTARLPPPALCTVLLAWQEERFRVHGLLTLARTGVHTLPGYRRQSSVPILLPAQCPYGRSCLTGSRQAGHRKWLLCVRPGTLPRGVKRASLQVAASLSTRDPPKFERTAPFPARYNARSPVRVFLDHPVIALTFGCHPASAMRPVPRGVGTSGLHATSPASLGTSNPPVRQDAVR